jgi:NhaP-type Na+/H+ and K+/H+ antiporter
MDFYFNPAGFVDRLSNMGVGMLVIFVVIGLIIGTTMLINWLFSNKK